MSRLIKKLPNLSLNDVHQVGKSYLTAHPKASITHKNQSVARELSKFEYQNKAERWLNLFSIYHKIKKNSELKSAIGALVERTFTESCFKPDPYAQDKKFEKNCANIHRAFMFQRGVNSIWLWGIGKHYLSEYPQPDAGYLNFFAHTNQPQAKALMDEAHHFKGKISWLYLYKLYESLRNRKGTLARNIEKIFQTHFHESVVDVAKALNFHAYKRQDILHMEEDNLDLCLDREQEIRFYQAHVDRIFNQNNPKLSPFEEASVFWIKREPYVRLTVGSLTVIAPVLGAFTLIPSLYTIFLMGIVVGGGVLILELVGNAAFKVEVMPQAAWKNMQENQKLLGENVLHFRHQIEDQQSQLVKRQQQIHTQEQLLDRQKELNQDQMKRVESLIGVTNLLTKSINMAEAQREEFLANIKSAFSENETISAKALENLSMTLDNNKKLQLKLEKMGGQNQLLTKEVSRLEKFIDRLSNLFKAGTKTANKNEELTKILQDLVCEANIIVGKTKVSQTLMQPSATAKTCREEAATFDPLYVL